jgi:hypothetical protein
MIGWSFWGGRDKLNLHPAICHKTTRVEVCIVIKDKIIIKIIHLKILTSA